MREQLAASLDLKNLDVSERAFLGACQLVERRFTGCNSPFEEFFHNLVHRVEMGTWPTPDLVADELEDFRRNFDDMRRDAARFIGAYPPAPATGASGAAGVTVPPQGAADQNPEVDQPEHDWMEKTPEMTYQLACFSPSDLEQKIELDRDEFIFLKRTLASRVTIPDSIEHG